jgi:hypothetical protein
MQPPPLPASFPSFVYPAAAKIVQVIQNGVDACELIEHPNRVARKMGSRISWKAARMSAACQVDESRSREVAFEFPRPSTAAARFFHAFLRHQPPRAGRYRRASQEDERRSAAMPNCNATPQLPAQSCNDVVREIRHQNADDDTI